MDGTNPNATTADRMGATLSAGQAQHDALCNLNIKVRPGAAALREATHDDVAAWFRAAWPKVEKYPTTATCWSVATHINAIVHAGNNKTRRKPSQDQLRDKKYKYLELLKHARLFIQKAPDILNDLEIRAYPITNATTTTYLNPEHLREIKAIEAAQTALAMVVETCKPPVEWKPRDKMDWIAEAAVSAWKTTGIAVPLGKGISSPLANFVSLTIMGIGLAQGDEIPSPEVISDHLRGRQARPRSGRRHPK